MNTFVGNHIVIGIVLGAVAVGSGCAKMGVTKRPALEAGAELPSLIRGLGNRLVMDVAADSWTNLCAKLNPTFTWNRRDMIWVERDGLGHPMFRLNRAYLYQPEGASRQWVVLRTQPGVWDESYSQVMGDNLAGVAMLHSSKPQSDHGSGNYAIVVSENEQIGTVYEVGWQKLMANGTSLGQVERRLYLLRSVEGIWTFLGEGVEEFSGKNGSTQNNTIRVTAQVLWQQSKNWPCRIKFLKESTDHEWLSEAEALSGRKPRRDLVLYEEWELNERFQQAHQITLRPYLRVSADDTLSGVVEHLSSWTLGWNTGDERERQMIQETWREGVLRLNPKVSLNQSSRSSKLDVLTYGETVKALHSLNQTSGSSDPIRPSR